MGVALNGKDDLRMLRGAVIIGFAGVALLFTVPRSRGTPGDPLGKCIGKCI